MFRAIVLIILQATILLCSATVLRAQENLSAPGFLRIYYRELFHGVRWTTVEHAIGYVIAWGPCQPSTACPWFGRANPAERGASTARVSASGAIRRLHTFALPSLDGWYGVSVHPVGDGVNFHEFSGYHRGWDFFVSGSGGSGKSASESRGSSKRDSVDSSTRVQVPTCALLPPTIRVTARAGSYPQCTRLGAAGIGVQSIIDGGFLDAVDVWSLVSEGVEVCFHDTGDFIFLDAANAPRTLSRLEGYLSDGMTCAEVFRPGSIVLIPGEGPGQARSVQANEQPLVLDLTVEVEKIALEDCVLTTTHGLNFRARPAGRRITILAKGTTIDAQLRTIDWHEAIIAAGVQLSALTRTSDWFRVDHEGKSGWISADYVTTAGTCDEDEYVDEMADEDL